MKLRLFLICLLTAGFLTWAAAASAGSKECLPPPDAEKFWKFITEVDPYKGWGHWPGYDEMYPGKSPHGAHLKLYANSIALKAAREGQETMPEGSIIIKENYAQDKESLKAVTPMYKVKGYNPEGGDWYWAKISPDGQFMASGKVEGCLGCHKARQDQDWIFTEPASE